MERGRVLHHRGHRVHGEGFIKICRSVWKEEEFYTTDGTEDTEKVFFIFKLGDLCELGGLIKSFLVVLYGKELEFITTQLLIKIAGQTEKHGEVKHYQSLTS
jgi:hypothetical protein